MSVRGASTLCEYDWRWTWLGVRIDVVCGLAQLDAHTYLHAVCYYLSMVYLFERGLSIGLMDPMERCHTWVGAWFRIQI